MGRLSEDLRDMGFTPTGKESPVDEDGTLWSKGHEIVCDETAVVIDGNHHVPEEHDEVETNRGRVVYRYRNSENVKMPGGYTGSYDWGKRDERFQY